MNKDFHQEDFESEPADNNSLLEDFGACYPDPRDIENILNLPSEEEQKMLLACSFKKYYEDCKIPRFVKIYNYSFDNIPPKLLEQFRKEDEEIDRMEENIIVSENSEPDVSIRNTQLNKHNKILNSMNEIFDQNRSDKSQDNFQESSVGQHSTISHLKSHNNLSSSKIISNSRISLDQNDLNSLKLQLDKKDDSPLIPRCLSQAQNTCSNPLPKRP
ncbi:unnamed protein product [Brachionus calyciflorus]|uniref:Uncharacterized protein n=1 Tax=Brachionus calyciflorus TaxID=104777 RepID=A0A813NS44_9BILA|nr:unnamed protein product [Brachionus calyciflorus]